MVATTGLPTAADVAAARDAAPQRNEIPHRWQIEIDALETTDSLM